MSMAFYSENVLVQGGLRGKHMTVGRRYGGGTNTCHAARESPVALVGKCITKKADALLMRQFGKAGLLNGKACLGFTINPCQLAKLFPDVYHTAGMPVGEGKHDAAIRSANDHQV